MSLTAAQAQFACETPEIQGMLKPVGQRLLESLFNSGDAGAVELDGKHRMSATDGRSTAGARSAVTGVAPALRRQQRPLDVTDVLWLVAIIGLALVLRGIYLYQFTSSPFYGHEMMDARFHRDWAQALASGKSFMDGPYFRAPLYPWLLAVVYYVFGTAPLMPRVIQIVLGSLNCGALYLIARQAFGRRVAVLAGIGAAIYWVFLYFDADLLTEGPALLLNSVLLLLLLRGGQRPSIGIWLSAGIVLGLSAITRPTILLFAPPTVVWILLLDTGSWRRGLAHVATFAAGCAVPVIPVAIRNVVVGHDRVLIASNSGLNFYLGNNPDSDGMSAVYPGMPEGWWPGYYDQIARAERAAGRHLKPSEVSQYYWDEGLRYWRERPAAALVLQGKKLLYFWSRWEVPNNEDVYFITERFTPLIRYLPLGFWAVGPLGLVGLLLSLRQARRLFPLWGFALVNMIAVVMFFVNGRYRLPVVPVLIVLGGFGVIWFVDRIRARRWVPATLMVVPLALASLLVAQIPPGLEAGYAQSCGATGVELANQGRSAEALRYLMEAVQRYDRLPTIWYTAGAVQMQLGNLSAAMGAFQHSLELDPNQVEARKQYGVALAKQGRTEAALEQWQKALRDAPNDVPLLESLAGMSVSIGRIADGADLLERAVELKPASQARFAQLAQNLMGERRLVEARQLMEAGLAKAPSDVALLKMAAKLYATSPDPLARDSVRALACGERACELTQWGDPDALDALAAAQFCAGQLEGSVESAQRALRLALEMHDQQLAARIQSRLTQYRAAVAAQTKSASQSITDTQPSGPRVPATQSSP